MKEYHRKGIKNYYLFSKDGRIDDGIDKDLKKDSNRLARRRFRQELQKSLDKEINLCNNEHKIGEVK